MKELWNTIGGLIGLFVFGYILYAAFASGNTVIGIIIIIAAVFIYFLSTREDKKIEVMNRKILVEAAKEEEERKRIQKIENMSENEFISFVRIHHDELDRHFKNGRITGLGHGVSSKRWSTSKYFVDSDIEDNDFNEFIKITRRRDGVEIFSGSWGYDI
ncbi:MAG TPA: hypothetical protein PKU90_02855 [Candidatus Paceibacterota bacterium]|jgi:uncharacterized membrane protein|nr:hypothetical protein [Candidatus Paceibacterota bacterium]